MIPDLAALQTMPGSEVLAAIEDALLAEAHRVRGVEDAFRPGAWEESRAGAHHAFCAAAAVINRLRVAGEEAKAKGAKPAALILVVADVARSALIVERQRQGGRAAMAEEAPDASAA